MAPRKAKTSKSKVSKAKARAAPARKAKPVKARAAPALPPQGAYAHIELYSRDTAATRAFYAEVFGWRFEDMSYGPGMTYLGYRAPAAPHGGVMPAMEGFPVSVLAYIQVDSVAKAQERIQQAGGKVLKGKYEVPNVGWFAVFEAPGGVVQAVWEQNPEFRPKP